MPELRTLLAAFLGLSLAAAMPPSDAAAAAPRVDDDLAGAQAACGTPRGLPPGRAAAAVLRPAPPPSLPPVDLLLAGRRWDNAVQIDKLESRSPEPGRPLRLAVIGDAEPGRFAFERIFSPGKDTFRRELRMIQARRPDVIVQLGDFVSRGTVKNYREHVRLLDEEVRLPLLTVIGNHDRSRPNGRADKVLYHALHGKSDFFCDVGGWRLIALDTADRSLTRAQLDWLGAVLDTTLRKAVFTHVPPIYLRRRFRPGETALDEGNPRGLTAGYFSEGSAEFGDLVARRRVDRVYMGHIHAFGVATYRGVPHILSGGGGSPLYPLPPGYPRRKMAHFILAELGSGGVAKETVVPMAGPEFELRVPDEGVSVARR